MSALIPGEQPQVILVDDELLEDVDKFKYVGLMLIAKARAPKRS